MYLKHHGIKGMKWGVRRFENYNGTLTPAGKRRYKKELRKEILRTNAKAFEKTGRYQDSEAREKIRQDYEKAMNSDKMKLLRYEANLASRDYADIEKKHGYEARDERIKRAVDSARKGDKLSTYFNVSDYMDSFDKESKAGKKAREAEKAYYEEYKKVSEPYIKKYRNTVVKELGFRDVKRGKQLLDEYNLWNVATIGMSSKDYSTPDNYSVYKNIFD